MSLATRAEAEELMDDAALPAADYAAVLRDLAQVNRLTLAARPTLAFLDRLRRPQPLRILDVGFGEGDMLRSISCWAKKRGQPVELIGIDLNPNSAPAAAAKTPPEMAIDYRTGDYADVGPVDVVISSLVAHHMSHPQLIAFLRFMEAQAAAGWMVNDLHRHALAHIGFPVLATVMRWHPIVRHDGRLSIARSFRPVEWQALLGEAGIAGAQVVRRFPFRLCVERRR